MESAAKTLAELAAICNGRLLGAEGFLVRGVKPLEEAGPWEIAPVLSGKSRKAAVSSGAGVLLLEEPLAGDSRPMILHPNPMLALAKLLDVFHPQADVQPGVREGAFVHPTAGLGPGVVVLQGAVVASGVRIGARTIVGYGVVVEENVVIGEDCLLKSRSVVCRDCRLGDRVILEPGAVIGAQGFGLAKDNNRWTRIPQVGNVILEEGVEVGANTCVDRATMTSTIIGAGTKIDNLVQIGHNSIVGRHTAIAAQAGLAGSTTVGEHVELGGQSGLAGHLTIGDNARVAAKSGVPGDVPPGRLVAGYPSMPVEKWKRMVAALAKLDEMRKALARMEKELGHG
ncbi:MAG: UDP-3-O-(3-hydroxymyristoyl)glucosamine N-acyltransferase [Deltaproteobacteria bacterium]|nr:UDP-3-O-(3-hydroxymyristoyl)glucosamine N-acyltransferase [Deltaproteobacteria bacterium]